MLRLIRQLNGLFNRRERWQLAILSVALIFRAGIELVGVGSIAPFMKVVADTSAIQTNHWLRWAYGLFAFNSATSFLTALGLAVVVVLAVSNAVSALTTWAMLRFSWGMHHRLCSRLLRGYLAQPYAFFVQRNSATLNQAILSEVQQVIQGLLTPILTVMSRSLVVLALVGLLIAIDPVLAMAIILVLGGAYGTLYMLVKSRQRRLGLERVRANQQRYKITAEAFGGIKDVKVLQRETSFTQRFLPWSWAFSKNSASNQTVAQLPRYLFDTIAFGGIVLIVLYYLRAGHGVASILPTISLYAFAGYRLMPELQSLFGGVAQIRFNHAALDDLTADFRQLRTRTGPPSPVQPLSFRHRIRFDRVTFRYPEAGTPALRDVSLAIPRNRTVGLVGSSGSGKTTLVDVLLGLYRPDSGRILIDGVPLDDATISAWRRQVGYVPQHIFLCDDTVASNIAFGIPGDEMDPERVERAARLAQLHDFVRSLPEGYRTLVGERGVRLSGGQRQRIGIARALYHDPEVLLLDEATSSLDGATEASVMRAIHGMAGRRTVLIIAHRLTTVADCDRIYMMEQGEILGEGTFEELVSGSQRFREMANLTSVASSGRS